MHAGGRVTQVAPREEEMPVWAPGRVFFLFVRKDNETA